MASFDVITDASRVGVSVQRATSRPADAARAAGLSAWFSAVTGEPLAVEKLPGDKARLYSPSAQQKRRMRAWLDKAVRPSPPDPDERLQVDLAPVFMPWAAKYGLLAGATVLVGGILIGSLVD